MCSFHIFIIHVVAILDFGDRPPSRFVSCCAQSYIYILSKINFRKIILSILYIIICIIICIHVCARAGTCLPPSFLFIFPGAHTDDDIYMRASTNYFRGKNWKMRNRPIFLFGGGRGALLTRREIESESLPRHKYMFTHTHTRRNKRYDLLLLLLFQHWLIGCCGCCVISKCVACKKKQNGRELFEFVSEALAHFFLSFMLGFCSSFATIRRVRLFAKF